jgi:hypothetical protein
MLGLLFNKIPKSSIALAEKVFKAIEIGLMPQFNTERFNYGEVCTTKLFTVVIYSLAW